MEAVIESKKGFRSTLIPIQEEKKLTCETLQHQKRKQKQLIAAGIIEKPKILWGFTPEERAEFDKGRSVDEVFDNIANKYGF